MYKVILVTSPGALMSGCLLVRDLDCIGQTFNYVVHLLSLLCCTTVKPYIDNSSLVL